MVCIVWMTDRDGCCVHCSERFCNMWYSTTPVYTHARLHICMPACPQSVSHWFNSSRHLRRSSVSLWLSLSHLNPGSEAGRYLRYFSWVKITFTVAQRGKSIPGVELKSGWCEALSSIHSHTNLPGGCRFSSSVFEWDVSYPPLHCCLIVSPPAWLRPVCVCGSACYKTDAALAPFWLCQWVHRVSCVHVAWGWPFSGCPWSHHAWS